MRISIEQQVSACGRRGIATLPYETVTLGHVGRQRERPVENLDMGLVAEDNVDTAVDDVHGGDVSASCVRRVRGHTGLDPASRRLAIVVVSIDDRDLGARCHVNALSNLRTYRVRLVSRYRERGQDADDGYYYHQFDQREALLFRSHAASQSPCTV